MERYASFLAAHLLQLVLAQDKHLLFAALFRDLEQWG